MRQAGFTLVELLVALALFGMLSAAAVSLLGFSVRTEDAAVRRNAELADLRRLGALMGSDLAQAVPRIARDAEGVPRPAFSGGPADMALVRGGWENPDGLPRASLQKVAYRLAGGRLERIAFPMLDGAAPLDPVALAEGLAGLRYRYRDAEGAWRDQWDAEDPRALPRAVELVLVPAAGAPVRQLFLVGGGA